MNADGWVIIETKLNSKQLEKDLKNQKKQLENYEKEAEKLLTSKQKNEKDLEPYQEEMAALREQVKFIEEMQISEKERAELIKKLQPEVDAINTKYEKQIAAYNQINKKIKENEINQKLLKERISETEIALKQANFINGFDKIGRSIEKVAKKVARWALAVFSIRSAYMAVRNAINVISQDDAQLRADIDYIKNAFAYALEPVVRKIVDLARQLLLIIQGIVYALSGKNIFENANKNLKSSVGSAKELKKTLAGFDEMNVLNDTSGGGSGSATEMPSFDLTDISMAEKTIEKLKSKWNELGEEMYKNLYETDFSIWTDSFGEWDLAVFGVIQQVYGLWRVISGLGEAVKGIIEMIVGIIEGDTEKIKEGFKDFIKGIWEAILGVVEFIKGFETTVKGIIKGLIHTLLGWLFDFINIGVEKVNGFINKINEKIGNLRDKIKKTVEDIQSWLTKKFGVVGTIIGEVIGGAFKGVVNAVLRVIENILNTPIKAINGLISAVGKIPGVNINKLQTFSFPRLAKGGVINMPGRGVPVGSAIGGERGQEGVIPLTDSQQMALLGETIGRYVTINATIPVYAYNRQVDRQIKRIQAENNFAGNR